MIKVTQIGAECPIQLSSSSSSARSQAVDVYNAPRGPMHGIAVHCIVNYVACLVPGRCRSSIWPAEYTCCKLQVPARRMRDIDIGLRTMQAENFASCNRGIDSTDVLTF